MGIFNCDWLSFTADFTPYQAEENPTSKTTLDPEQNKQLAKLFALLDVEREKPEGGFVDLGLFKFEVYPHGSRRYYYILHNEDFELQLARFRSKAEANYPVYIHFKSQFLWSNLYGCSTLSQKFELVKEWLEQVLGCKYITSKINRMDLCYHTDDIPHDYNVDAFVGRFVLDDVKRTHRKLSSINLGSLKSDQIYLRTYNKFIELKNSKKTWFIELWQNAGLDIRNVWNIEFQLSRDFFKETKIKGCIKETVEDVIAAMPAIWLYLTTDWITYRIPDNPRRARWSLHPWWMSLYTFVETNDRLSRDRQRELPTKDSIMPGLRGLLTSLAARLDVSFDDGSLFQMLKQELLEYDEKNERSFAEDIEKKKMLMDPENTGHLEAAVATELIVGVDEEYSDELPQVEPEVTEMIEQLLLFEHMPIQYNRILAQMNKKKEPVQEAPSVDLQL